MRLLTLGTLKMKLCMIPICLKMVIIPIIINVGSYVSYYLLGMCSCVPPRLPHPNIETPEKIIDKNDYLIRKVLMDDCSYLNHPKLEWTKILFLFSETNIKVPIPRIIKINHEMDKDELDSKHESYTSEIYDNTTDGYYSRQNKVNSELNPTLNEQFIVITNTEGSISEQIRKEIDPMVNTSEKVQEEIVLENNLGSSISTEPFVNQSKTNLLYDLYGISNLSLQDLVPMKHHFPEIFYRNSFTKNYRTFQNNNKNKTSVRKLRFRIINRVKGKKSNYSQNLFEFLKTKSQKTLNDSSIQQTRASASTSKLNFVNHLMKSDLNSTNKYTNNTQKMFEYFKPKNKKLSSESDLCCSIYDSNDNDELSKYFNMKNISDINDSNMNTEIKNRIEALKTKKGNIISNITNKILFLRSPKPPMNISINKPKYINILKNFFNKKKKLNEGDKNFGTLEVQTKTKGTKEYTSQHDYLFTCGADSLAFESPDGKETIKPIQNPKQLGMKEYGAVDNRHSANDSEGTYPSTHLGEEILMNNKLRGSALVGPLDIENTHEAKTSYDDNLTPEETCRKDQKLCGSSKNQLTFLNGKDMQITNYTNPAHSYNLPLNENIIHTLLDFIEDESHIQVYNEMKLHSNRSLLEQEVERLENDIVRNHNIENGGNASEDVQNIVKRQITSSGE
uniref:Uncharacterized protein n=1 Tax=Cacopsylla melanoneura TaxID=428564 RepID=A0A8D9BLS2_9HEMI